MGTGPFSVRFDEIESQCTATKCFHKCARPFGWAWDETGYRAKNLDGHDIGIGLLGTPAVGMEWYRHENHVYFDL